MSGTSVSRHLGAFDSVESLQLFSIGYAGRKQLHSEAL